MQPEDPLQIKMVPEEMLIVPANDVVPKVIVTADALVVPQVVATPQLKVEPEVQAPELPTEAPYKSPLKQIRTFEGDVADAIKMQNESLISIQRKEEKRRDAVQTFSPNTSEDEHHFSWKILVMSLFTIIFIGGGGYGAYYALSTYNEKTALPSIDAPLNQFIGVGKTQAVDASILGRQAIIDLVEATRLDARDGDSLEQIQMRRGIEPTSELLESDDLLSRLDSHAPNPLVRALSPIFMLGVLGSDPSHTVLLIKLKSFENAYPGMLDWESRIIEDLLPLFINREEVANIATDSVFKDKTIQNHDTRVVRNVAGQIVFLYGFFDNNMLVITDNENSFRTVVNRLQAEKLSR